MHTTKALSRVEIKDAEKGEVAAIFSTFDVIDSDGDVTLKGAFTDGAPVAISAYGHQSWKGALPVGKGRIRETSTEAVMEGRFFMDTTHGADTFRTVKAMSEDDNLQEWSYSLANVKSEPGTVEGKRVRVLKAIDVTEVSPVLKGAGVNTRTLTTKGKQLNSELYQSLAEVGREQFGDDSTEVWVDDFDQDEGWVVFSVYSADVSTLQRVNFERSDTGDVSLVGDGVEVERTTLYVPPGGDGKQFSEHAKSVLADVDGLITRATEVMALRAQKGKGISPSAGDLLTALDGDLARLKGLLCADHNPTDDEVQAALQREFLRFASHCI